VWTHCGDPRGCTWERGTLKGLFLGCFGGCGGIKKPCGEEREMLLQCTRRWGRLQNHGETRNSGGCTPPPCHPPQPPALHFEAERLGRTPGLRGEGLLLSASAQGLQSSRGGWGCGWGGAQACRQPAPPKWVPSPRARRRPNRPTGLIPRPVYQEGSMSGSARQKPRSSQGVNGGDTGRAQGIASMWGGNDEPWGVGIGVGGHLKAAAKAISKHTFASA